MEKVSIAGLLVDPITKFDLLEKLRHRLRNGEKTFIITPYSEFLYAVMQRPQLLTTLNRAQFSVSDGMGLLIAANYLAKPLSSRGYALSIIEACFQMLNSLFSALFFPSAVKNIIPEKIVGADLFWDLAKLAHDGGHSLYLLGGFGDTPERVKQILEARFPGVRVVGFSNKGPDDHDSVKDIMITKPDLLLVAYGPIRQELWIAQHLDNLPVKLVIGLGGTFDYVAGVKSQPPRFIRTMGMEWLWRLFTQPKRIKRIYHATYGMLRGLVRYKVFTNRPLRPNVIAVILNPQNQFLVCKRKFKQNLFAKLTSEQITSDYWQFPQGGVETGEDLVEAAIREAHEETGLNELKFIGISPSQHSYEWRNATRSIFFNRLKFRGQEQSIAYLRLYDDQPVHLDNREFDAWQWVPYEKLLDALHDERKVLVDIIKADEKIWLE